VVLCCGLTEKASQAVAPLLAGCEIRMLDENGLVALVEAPLDPTPALILCGEMLRDPGPLEAAQLLRSQCREGSIYFVIDGLPTADRRHYIKNGYTDAFSVRLDQRLMRTAVAEAVGTALGVRAFRPVRLLEMEPGQTLPFDTALYLPGNQKYIRLSAAGDPLDADRAARLKEHGVRSLHVPLDQIREYNAHTASRLQVFAGMGRPGQPSEKLQGAVRALLTSVLTELDREGTFPEGRASLNQATEIVKTFLRPPGSTSSVYERILMLSDEGANAYCHSSNVATIAALIALGTGAANPDHMALAGLLHDVGLAHGDEDLEARDPASLSLQERVRLFQHVPDSLEIIRKRKILLPTEAARAVADHHERHDGSGYPDSKVGPKVSLEGQILGIADTLDRATAEIPGRTRVSIKDWIRGQRQGALGGGGPKAFEPGFLKKCLALFPKDE